MSKLTPGGDRAAGRAVGSQARGAGARLGSPAAGRFIGCESGGVRTPHPSQGSRPHSAHHHLGGIARWAAVRRRRIAVWISGVALQEVAVGIRFV